MNLLTINLLVTGIELISILVIFILFKNLLNLGWQAIASRWFSGNSEKFYRQRRTLSFLLVISFGLLGILLLGVNALLIYQQKSIVDFQLGFLAYTPREFWINLLVAIVKSISLLLLVKLSLPWLDRFLDRASIYVQNIDQIIANNESIQAFFATLKDILNKGIWLFALISCTQFLQLPSIIIEYLFIILKAYISITLGLLFIKAMLAIIDTLDDISVGLSEHKPLLKHYQRFRHLVPVFKKCLEYIFYIAIATFIFSQINWLAWLSNYTNKSITVIIISLIAGILVEFANIILEDLVLRTEHLTDLQRQRRLTIIPLFKSFLKYFIYFTAVIAILNLFNINPAPILAGAGIVGIAVGFGAQNLINDIVCGFFILFENYYLVGDYIEVGRLEERNLQGVVEAIELRTTHIRHPDGQLQIIRNGEIGSIVNYSKQYTYARVDIPLDYNINLPEVHSIIAEVGQQMKEEFTDVLEATRVEGLAEFGESSLFLRTITKVKPGKHLAIQQHLRSLLKQSFDEHKIKMISSQPKE